jgi:nucleoid DNA-binding protein
MKTDPVRASQRVYEAFQVVTTGIERANEVALSGFDETKIHERRAIQARTNQDNAEKALKEAKERLRIAESKVNNANGVVQQQL